jgi:hypothetical protein
MNLLVHTRFVFTLTPPLSAAMGNVEFFPNGSRMHLPCLLANSHTLGFHKAPPYFSKRIYTYQRRIKGSQELPAGKMQQVDPR